ncbi:hypothetical protein [Kordiimonas sp.]
MNGDEEKNADHSPSDASVPDDFSTAQPSDADERRLHLRAFDYWLQLKAENAFPLFKDLTPQGLAPFKTNTLLLEFTSSGAVVRFAGDDVKTLMNEPIGPGVSLEGIPQSAFAGALLGQFETDDGRERAAEFEFAEGSLDCRGIMLPFSRTGHAPHFIMVVVSYRAPGNKVEEAETAQVAPELDDRLGACERAAGRVAHLDGGGRDNLYQALAAALALYEEGENAPDAYDALLKRNKLRAQDRAPFTPVLKLTFGKDYDKTRLTEYASALAFARRQGETSESLVAFLKAQPGGIKGCVKAERMARRGEVGNAAHTRQDEARAHALGAPALTLDTFNSDSEFCLVLARRKDGGGLEAIGVADAGPTTVDTMVRRFKKK